MASPLHPVGRMKGIGTLCMLFAIAGCGSAHEPGDPPPGDPAPLTDADAYFGTIDDGSLRVLRMPAGTFEVEAFGPAIEGSFVGESILAIKPLANGNVVVTARDGARQNILIGDGERWIPIPADDSGFGVHAGGAWLWSAGVIYALPGGDRIVDSPAYPTTVMGDSSGRYLVFTNGPLATFDRESGTSRTITPEYSWVEAILDDGIAYGSYVMGEERVGLVSFAGADYAIPGVTADRVFTLDGQPFHRGDREVSRIASGALEPIFALPAGSDVEEIYAVLPDRFAIVRTGAGPVEVLTEERSLGTLDMVLAHTGVPRLTLVNAIETWMDDVAAYAIVRAAATSTDGIDPGFRVALEDFDALIRVGRDGSVSQFRLATYAAPGGVGTRSGEETYWRTDTHLVWADNGKLVALELATSTQAEHDVQYELIDAAHLRTQ